MKNICLSFLLVTWVSVGAQNSYYQEIRFSDTTTLNGTLFSLEFDTLDGFWQIGPVSTKDSLLTTDTVLYTGQGASYPANSRRWFCSTVWI